MRQPVALATSAGAPHSHSMHGHSVGDDELCRAVREGQLKRALILLEKSGPRQLEWQSSRGDGNSLYWAAVHGQTELVRLLLDKGAKVDSRTSWRATPLHAAADSNKCDLVRLLVARGADVNAQTERKDTPCHMAAYRGHAQCVQLLVEAGCNLDLCNKVGHDVWNEASDPVTLRYLQAVAQLYGRTRPLSEVVVNSPRFADESCECGKSCECNFSSPSSHEGRHGYRLPSQHPSVPTRTSEAYPPVHQHQQQQQQHQYQHQQYPQQYPPQYLQQYPQQYPQQPQPVHVGPVMSLGLPVQHVPASSYREPVQVEQDENNLSVTLESSPPPSPSSVSYYNIPPYRN